MIRCETALEIAVQEGHRDIVELLLEQETNAIRCREYGGRTPLMTAVKHGRLDIFNLLLSKGANISERCVNGQNLSFEFAMNLGKNELIKYENHKCHVESTIGHLAAIHGNVEIIRILPRELLEVGDAFNATPFHFAACHAQYSVIGALAWLAISPSKRTSNGSTIMHSAASCKQVIALCIFEEREYFKNILYQTDNENRTHIHILFMHGTKPLSFIEKRDQNEKDKAHLHHYFEKSPHFIGMRKLADGYNRTPFHYAAISGKWYVFIYHLRRYYQETISLMRIKDYFNDTALDLVLKSADYINTLNLYFNCSSGYDLLSCDFDHTLVLTDHEICLWFILYFNDFNRDIYEVNEISKYIKILILKNSIYGLIIMKSFLPHVYKHAVFKVENWIKMHALEYDKTGRIGAQVFYKEFSLCNQPYNVSVFHKIMFNSENDYWMYSPSYSSFTLSSMCSWVENIDQCFDKDGYNLLHRAIMGGHAGGVRMLLHNCRASVNVRAKSGETALQLLLKYTPFCQRIFYSQIIHETILNDKGPVEEKRRMGKISELKEHNFVSDILLGLNNFELHDLKFSELCSTTKKGLSIIHMISAKGLTNIVKYLGKKFGKKLLACRSVHGFTPIYLARNSIIKQQKHI